MSLPGFQFRGPRGPAAHAPLCVAVALAFLTVVTSAATAQLPVVPGTVPELHGRIVLGGNGVPDAPVALHRITSLESGEIAGTVTDSAGRFRFPLEVVPGSSFTVYFVTADYNSVRFFGQPLHPDSAASSEYVLPVYDTTSVLTDPIRFAARDIFMVADLLGGWEVLEILRILNPTNLAYVGRDGIGPWEFRIPEGATDFQVGEAAVMPHELSWVGDRVLHLTPVTPGMREAFISYRLPRGPASARLAIGEPTDTLNVFVRQPSHLTAIAGLQTTRRIDVEGESFLQYGGVDLQPGSTLEITWGRPEGPPVDPRLAAIVVTLAILAFGIFAAIRNRGTAAN